MSKSSRRNTALRIIADQADKMPVSVHQSLEAAVGLLQIQFLALGIELTLKTSEQSGERLLQCLVSISSIALTAVASHVIPELEKEEA